MFVRLSFAAILSCLTAAAARADQAGIVDPVDVTDPRAAPNPDQGDSFRPFLADTYTVDDNLFRLPAAGSYLSNIAGPGASRADHENTVSAGVDGRQDWNRQTFLVDLRADYNRFLRNSEFDGTTGSGKLEWDWQASPVLAGQAGASLHQYIPNFQDTLFYQRDFFRATEYFAKAQLQPGPRWNLTGGLREDDYTNSNVALQGGDFRSKTGSVGVHYFTLAEDSFGWEYQYTNGTFNSPGVFDGIVFNRDFHDDSARFAGKYSPLPSLVFDANAGYLDHKNPYAGFGSFSGDVWRASLSWQPDPKVQVLLAAYRDLTAYLDVQSAFFVSRGYSVAPTWTPRDKISLALSVDWEKHDFLQGSTGSTGTGSGDALAPATGVPRRDDLRLAQATLTYTPRRPLVLKVSYQRQQRGSNVDRFAFVDHSVIASLSVTF